MKNLWRKALKNALLVLLVWGLLSLGLLGGLLPQTFWGGAIAAIVVCIGWWLLMDWMSDGKIDGKADKFVPKKNNR